LFQIPFKTLREGEARMLRESLFQAAGTEYEKAQAPNLVQSLGRQ